MKVIVVGAGGIARDLLRGLGDMWDITLVDTDRERLAQAEEVRAVSTIQGDATLRPTLDEAGLGGADALIAAANRDEVNLVACMLASEALVPTVVAVAADPERLDDYRDLGVPVFSPDRLTSRHIEIALEPRRVSSAAFAEGAVEALEFRLAADSPLRGKPLAELGFDGWLVVAVLREGQLVIPHGGTVLREGDIVTVVGDHDLRGDIIETFTAGEASFPLDFGPNVAVAISSPDDLEGPLVAEALHMVRASAAEGLVVVYRGDEWDAEDRAAELGPEVRVLRVPAETSAAEAIRGLVTTAGVGVAALPDPPGRFRRRAIASFLTQAADLGTAVLLARGSHPYRKLLVQVGSDQTPAARAAIDLAAFRRLDVTAIAATPPPFIASRESMQQVADTAARMREEAAVQGVTVRVDRRQGNPVRLVEDAVDEHTLLVVSAGAASSLTLRVPGHLVRRATSSVLVIPPGE